MTKVGELRTKKAHFVIYNDESDQVAPFKVYRKWYDSGWHRKLEDSGATLYKCLLFLEDYVLKNYQ